jgi:hypothetical protein
LASGTSAKTKKTDAVKEKYFRNNLNITNGSS